MAPLTLTERQIRAIPVLLQTFGPELVGHRSGEDPVLYLSTDEKLDFQRRLADYLDPVAPAVEVAVDEEKV